MTPSKKSAATRDPELEQVVQKVQEQVKAVQEGTERKQNGVRAWVVAITIALLLSLSAVTIFDFVSKLLRSAELVELKTAPINDWIIIHRSDITDGTTVDEPRLDTHYEIRKALILRINSNPRNVETGEVVCSGRSTVGLALDPGTVRERMIRLSALAGLASCQFRPGAYISSLTWNIIDRATGVELVPILMEDEFVITDALAAGAPVAPTSSTTDFAPEDAGTKPSTK